MNRLNRKVEYALIALKHMSASKNERITVKEICETTGIPFDATSRVMQLMAQREILKAVHGAHGGYALIKDLSLVSFFEIIEIILGPVEAVRCASADYECEFFAKCNMVSPFKKFNEKLIEFYKSLCVQDLLYTPTLASTQAPTAIQPEARA